MAEGPANARVAVDVITPAVPAAMPAEARNWRRDRPRGVWPGRRASRDDIDNGSG